MCGMFKLLPDLFRIRNEWNNKTNGKTYKNSNSDTDTNTYTKARDYNLVFVGEHGK